jgi:hypothetical protein
MHARRTGLKCGIAYLVVVVASMGFLTLIVLDVRG